MERQIDGERGELRDMERHGVLKRQDQWKDRLRNGEILITNGHINIRVWE